MKEQYGFSLIESLLAVSLLFLIATSFIIGLLYAQESIKTAGNLNRAVFLADEGSAIFKSLGDTQFQSLANGTYGFSLVNNTWSLSGILDKTDIFTRSVTISSPDANTRQADITISWPQTLQRVGMYTIHTYVTNWQRVAQGSWANPVLAGSLSQLSNDQWLKVQYQGSYAYVVTNTSSGANFYVISIANLTSPSIVGSLHLSAAARNLVVSGHYVYIVDSSNTAQLQIIDVSTPQSPTLASTFNVAGNASPNALTKIGNTLYLVRGGTTNNVVLVNVANPLAPTLLGSGSFSSSLHSITVVGSYAYIGTGNSKVECIVVNISNPSALTLIGSINLPGNQNVLSTAFWNNTLYLGTSAGILYAVNATSPSSLSLIRSLNLNGNIDDMTTNGSGLLFAATGNAASDFQVISVANPSVLSVYGSLTTAQLLHGITYDASRDVVYTTGNKGSLYVIKPG